jgi:hypothetical protein
MTIQGYDLVGDIHGHADALHRLLRALDYVEIEGVFRHPERQMIFVGDFTDRGPQQREVLRIAHSMCDAGAARAVMEITNSTRSGGRPGTKTARSCGVIPRRMRISTPNSLAKLERTLLPTRRPLAGSGACPSGSIFPAFASSILVDFYDLPSWTSGDRFQFSTLVVGVLSRRADPQIDGDVLHDGSSLLKGTMHFLYTEINCYSYSDS